MEQPIWKSSAKNGRRYATGVTGGSRSTRRHLCIIAGENGAVDGTVSVCIAAAKKQKHVRYSVNDIVTPAPLLRGGPPDTIFRLVM